ncbi:MAG: formate dehydrogenase subunit gamma [Alcaligenaceae bacterium]|jgi:formate dehydrogenase subunit gamma|nr:formate dehydrogenase subunit gamma [Alcaligenaceae bacterium]
MTQPNKQVEQVIQRYRKVERVNHWVTAGCFVLLAISGLAFFYPAFFWLTGVFGTPQLARILHPWIGVVMFLSFMIMFFRYAKHNILNKEDTKWLTSVGDILKGRAVGDVGKYNAGQKAMFWLMSICMLTLLVTGLLSWHAYFGEVVPIPLKRVGLLLHAASALVLIAGIIVHVYAAIWVRGTIRAMVEGVVSQAWARTHHPRWYREVMAKRAEKAKTEGGSAL